MKTKRKDRFHPCGTEKGNPWHTMCKDKRCRARKRP